MSLVPREPDEPDETGVSEALVVDAPPPAEIYFRTCFDRIVDIHKRAWKAAEDHFKEFVEPRAQEAISFSNEYPARELLESENESIDGEDGLRSILSYFHASIFQAQLTVETQTRDLVKMLQEEADQRVDDTRREVTDTLEVIRSDNSSSIPALQQQIANYRVENGQHLASIARLEEEVTQLRQEAVRLMTQSDQSAQKVFNADRRRVSAEQQALKAGEALNKSNAKNLELQQTVAYYKEGDAQKELDRLTGLEKELEDLKKEKATWDTRQRKLTEDKGVVEKKLTKALNDASALRTEQQRSSAAKLGLTENDIYNGMAAELKEKEQRIAELEDQTAAVEREMKKNKTELQKITALHDDFKAKYQATLTNLKSAFESRNENLKEELTKTSKKARELEKANAGLQKKLADATGRLRSLNISGTDGNTYSVSEETTLLGTIAELRASNKQLRQQHEEVLKSNKTLEKSMKASSRSDRTDDAEEKRAISVLNRIRKHYFLVKKDLPPEGRDPPKKKKYSMSLDTTNPGYQLLTITLPSIYMAEDLNEGPGSKASLLLVEAAKRLHLDDVIRVNLQGTVSQIENNLTELVLNPDIGRHQWYMVEGKDAEATRNVLADDYMRWITGVANRIPGDDNKFYLHAYIVSAKALIKVLDDTESIPVLSALGWLLEHLAKPDTWAGNFDEARGRAQEMRDLLIGLNRAIETATNRITKPEKKIEKARPVIEEYLRSYADPGENAIRTKPLSAFVNLLLEVLDGEYTAESGMQVEYPSGSKGTEASQLLQRVQDLKSANAELRARNTTIEEKNKRLAGDLKESQEQVTTMAKSYQEEVKAARDAAIAEVKKASSDETLKKQLAESTDKIRTLEALLNDDKKSTKVQAELDKMKEQLTDEKTRVSNMLDFAKEYYFIPASYVATPQGDQPFLRIETGGKSPSPGGFEDLQAVVGASTTSVYQEREFFKMILGLIGTGTKIRVRGEIVSRRFFSNDDAQSYRTFTPNSYWAKFDSTMASLRENKIDAALQAYEKALASEISQVERPIVVRVDTLNQIVNSFKDSTRALRESPLGEARFLCLDSLQQITSTLRAATVREAAEEYTTVVKIGQRLVEMEKLRLERLRKQFTPFNFLNAEARLNQYARDKNMALYQKAMVDYSKAMSNASATWLDAKHFASFLAADLKVDDVTPYKEPRSRLIPGEENATGYLITMFQKSGLLTEGVSDGFRDMRETLEFVFQTLPHIRLQSYIEDEKAREELGRGDPSLRSLFAGGATAFTHRMWRGHLMATEKWLHQKIQTTHAQIQNAQGGLISSSQNELNRWKIDLKRDLFAIQVVKVCEFDVLVRHMGAIFSNETASDEEAESRTEAETIGSSLQSLHDWWRGFWSDDGEDTAYEHDPRGTNHWKEGANLLRNHFGFPAKLPHYAIVGAIEKDDLHDAPYAKSALTIVGWRQQTEQNYQTLKLNRQISVFNEGLPQKSGVSDTGVAIIRALSAVNPYSQDLNGGDQNIDNFINRLNGLATVAINGLQGKFQEITSSFDQIDEQDRLGEPNLWKGLLDGTFARAIQLRSDPTLNDANAYKQGGSLHKQFSDLIKSIRAKIPAAGQVSASSAFPLAIQRGSGGIVHLIVEFTRAVAGRLHLDDALDEAFTLNYLLHDGMGHALLQENAFVKVTHDPNIMKQLESLLSGGNPQGQGRQPRNNSEQATGFVLLRSDEEKDTDSSPPRRSGHPTPQQFPGYGIRQSTNPRFNRRTSFDDTETETNTGLFVVRPPPSRRRAPAVQSQREQRSRAGLGSRRGTAAMTSAVSTRAGPARPTFSVSSSMSSSIIPRALQSAASNQALQASSEYVRLTSTLNVGDLTDIYTKDESLQHVVEDLLRYMTRPWLNSAIEQVLNWIYTSVHNRHPARQMNLLHILFSRRKVKAVFLDAVALRHAASGQFVPSTTNRRVDDSYRRNLRSNIDEAMQMVTTAADYFSEAGVVYEDPTSRIKYVDHFPNFRK